MRRLFLAALAAGAVLAAGPAHAKGAETGTGFGFESLFGGYNQANLQIGYAVFQHDCASCHGLNLLRYKDLQDIGLKPEEVASLIAAIKRPDGTDSQGKPKMVKVTPDDRITWSYPDAKAAAAANHGAVPPDLSVFEAGRENGADYVQSLLLGYRAAPPNLTVLPHHYYNVAFPGGQIAMAPPLKSGSITLADGKSPSKAEMAHDVAEFLAWSADPHLEDRKIDGIGAMLFLLVFGGIGAVAFGRKRAS